MVKGKKQKHKLSAAVVGSDDNSHVFKVTKKRAVIGGVCLVVVLAATLALISYIQIKNKKLSAPSLTSEYTRSLQALSSPKAKPLPKGPSLQQNAQSDYNKAKARLKGKTTYQKSDIPALTSLAYAASVLGKRSESRSAAASALQIMNAQPDFDKQYASIKVSMEALAK